MGTAERPDGGRSGNGEGVRSPGAERLSERELTGYTTVPVPTELRELRVQLERRDEHATLRVSAVITAFAQALRLHPVLGGDRSNDASRMSRRAVAPQ
ncbi:hypothetical protein JG687_00014846 [Phytophthora cactorum]|nr:hypothetical protein JG687_00014846 [Phytophthora cactorum]